MNTATFHLPVWFDLGATFAFGLTGALAAIKRGYDIVGVFFLALATGLGGGLIRDGVFIPGSEATPLLTDPRYIETIMSATVAGALFGGRVKKFHRLVAVIDALGLGAYAAFGTEKALTAGLAVPAAVLVGVINAAGGGLLRDILTREEPLVFKPGQFYVLTAFAGAVVFVFLADPRRGGDSRRGRGDRGDVCLSRPDDRVQLADGADRNARRGGRDAVEEGRRRVVSGRLPGGSAGRRAGVRISASFPHRRARG